MVMLFTNRLRFFSLISIIEEIARKFLGIRMKADNYKHMNAKVAHDFFFGFLQYVSLNQNLKVQK